MLLVAATVAASLVGGRREAAAAPGAVRIMPLGDSITAGHFTLGGYRYALEDYLSGGGWDFDFVGSQNSGLAPLDDRDHEGHGGFTIGQIDVGVAGWLTAAAPDFVLLMAGTNDLTPTGIVGATARLGALVDKINQLRPATRVIVSLIPPNTDYPALAEQFNAELPGVINARIALGRPVRLINPALTLADLEDQRHPNMVGYRKLARAWFEALVPLLPAPSRTDPVALSAIQEVEGYTNGSGPLARDRSNGNNGLLLNGAAFARGLGTHATAVIDYDLRSSRYATFSATIGIDDEVGSGGTSVFSVLVDGVERYNSGLMTGTSATRTLSVSVAGASALRLVQSDGGDGSLYDHGDWANAQLSFASPPPVTTSTSTTTTTRPPVTPTTRGVPPPDAPPGAGGEGEFHLVAPARLYDSRAARPLGAGETRNIAILNSAGVPAAGVQAVALNITADRASQPTFVSVFPRDDRQVQPGTSNLNPIPARPTSTLVFARVGLGGQISVFNSAGSVDVIVDVMGWFGASSAPRGARFVPQPPSRCFDTRQTQPLRPGGAVAASFTGARSTAQARTSAVLTNLTATGASAATYVQAFPYDDARPIEASLPPSSNLNVVPAQPAVANAAIVALDPRTGSAAFYNADGRVDLICDLYGSFDTSPALPGAGGSALRPLAAPVRLVDTRGASALGPGAARDVEVAPVGKGVVAAVLTLTAISAGAPGFLSAFPASQGVAEGTRTSAVNFDTAAPAPNLVVVPVDPLTGRITLANGAVSALDVLVDVVGYFAV